MNGQFRFISKCLHLSCFLSCVLMATTEISIRNRVKRQSGYVYNRPSISFDLPSRPISTSAPTSAPSPAPNIERTQGQGVQQMYYAYPAPNTVNIGYSTTGTTVTAASGAASGASSSGYSYGTPTSPATQPNPTTGRPSTNAPEYLPPLGSSPDAGISSSGAGVGYTSVATATTSTAATPTESYLPPVSTTTTSSGSSSAAPVPDAGYFLPKPPSTFPPPSYSPSPTSPSPATPSPIPTTPATPKVEYLPPSPTLAPVPTPAVTYLPPVL